MKDIRQGLGPIQVEVRKRMAAQGLTEPVPSLEMIHLINEEFIKYWAAVEEAENGVDVDAYDLKSESYFRDGRETGCVYLENAEGERIVVAQVIPSEAALYFPGHKVTIEGGKLISRHPDGKLCALGCKGCDEPDPRIISLDGESFVFCSNCGTETILYPDPFMAISAWIIAKARSHEVV